ncbi:MAG: glycoside hydrolase family 99-like domain-containing protein, partial [Opitutales bacterium]|nr:glycoside hydrolase family 99-like domain-containing protein [Opitutales bacterium]
SQLYAFDAAFSYNAIFRKEPYEKWGERMLQTYDKHKATVGLYYPVVSTGWDNNPRYPAGEYTLSCKNKNPKDFEKNLRMAKKWVEGNIPEGMRFLLINAWDEWTEGEFLQPDKTYGYGYLNAVARVFGGSGQATDGSEKKPEPQPAASAVRGHDLSKRQGKGLYYK